MNPMLNRVVEDMVMQKKLSAVKIRHLFALKRFIDRVAGTDYLETSEVEALQQKFGVQPDVISWGDYFQVEVASDHWDKEDAEFQKIISTIMFDVIAAALVFTDRTEKFVTHTLTEGKAAEAIDPHERNIEQQEAVHLLILQNYYEQMKLNADHLDQEDLDFFGDFFMQRAS